MTDMAAEEGLGSVDPSEVIELGPGDEGLGDVHPGAHDHPRQQRVRESQLALGRPPE